MTTARILAINTATSASNGCKLMRSLRPLTVIVLMVMSALVVLAQNNAHDVDWKLTIPPKGYIPEKTKQEIIDGTLKLKDYKNPNPPLDFDLYGDKKKTAWSVPITIEGGFATTDEKGNLVFMAGIPDPEGLKDPKKLGWGEDHFSPRFRPKGGKAEGEELGACVYRWGRNLWYLDFVDANGNKIPDQFLKSRWRSRNGQRFIKDPKDATKEIENPRYNERTYFVTDLTAAKVQYIKTIRKQGEENLDKLFSFGDAEIEDLGDDLTPDKVSGSDVDGTPVPSQTKDDKMPLEINILHDVTNQPLVGEAFPVYAEITNTDYVSHIFYFASLGVNAAVSGTPTPFFLGPGETAPYTLTVSGLQSGWASASVLAWSDALTDGDGALDTVLFNVQ
jgi:hypothetical protein